MGVCVGHEPCPKCGSRDNLGRYDDGSGFCFGCRHYEPPSHFKYTPEQQPDKEEVKPPMDACNELPDVNREWLQQYITDAEIDQWFTYSPLLRRHLFIHESEDAFGKKHTFWEARSVTRLEDGRFSFAFPKTFCHGEKPFFILSKWRKTGKLVLVEDPVSAIKVSRFCETMPLFGSIISIDTMLQIANMPWIKEVIIWLDRDKYKEALGFANRISKFKSVRVVSTDKDPKSQTDEEIQEVL